MIASLRRFIVVLVALLPACTAPKVDDRIVTTERDGGTTGNVPLDGPDISDPCVNTTSAEDDCGFELALRETCEPGEVVAVGCAVGCGLGDEICEGGPVLRICAGARTCTHDDAVRAGGFEAGDNCDVCPFRRFPCPREGSVSVYVRSIAPGEGVHLVCDVQMSRDFVVDITRPCAASIPYDNRLCGFSDRGEIDCEPGETVWIGCAAGCGMGSCEGRPILRICDAERGVHCEKDHMLTGFDVLRAGNDCDDDCPFGSFECPASGRARVFEAPEAGEGETTCNLVHGPAPARAITEPCTESSTSPDRNCGWHRQGEIACTPGMTYTAGCSPTCGVGACSGRPMMRLCDVLDEARCSDEVKRNLGINFSACDDPICPFEDDIVCPESGSLVAFWAAEVPEDVVEDVDEDGELTHCTIAIAPMPAL